MEKVRIDELANAVQPAAVMRHLTEPLGLTDVAINYYRRRDETNPPGLNPIDHFRYQLSI